MSAFTPAPHGPCGKEEQAQAYIEVSCSAPRAGLGSPKVFPGGPEDTPCWEGYTPGAI